MDVIATAALAATLLFHDEFRGKALNTNVWYRCFPYADENAGCSNGLPYDLEWFLAQNVTVGGGQRQSTALEQSIDGYNYSSGMIERPDAVPLRRILLPVRLRRGARVVPAGRRDVAGVLALAGERLVAAGDRRDGVAGRHADDRLRHLPLARRQGPPSPERHAVRPNPKPQTPNPKPQTQPKGY